MSDTLNKPKTKKTSTAASSANVEGVGLKKQASHAGKTADSSKTAATKKVAAKTNAADKSAANKSAATKQTAAKPKQKVQDVKDVPKNQPSLAEQTAELVDSKILSEIAASKVQEIAASKEEKKGFFARFKKNKIRPDAITNAKRYSPDVKRGLSDEQVNERVQAHFINDTDTKYSKSYKSIFIGNIFTFFNLLCFIAAGALIYARADFIDMFFVIIFSANIIIGIIQEIKAKLSIEKLSIMATPTAKVMRGGNVVEINTKNIVLDDVILLTAGQQIPTDCILAGGVVEVNESLLTGESVPVKKEMGDSMYAGSFVSSGSCIVRAEKVGKFNYIETLTSKAKKYKKPNSELLNSLKLIMTVIGILIIPITAFMFKINLSSGTMSDADVIKRTTAVVIGMIPAGMFLLTSMALAVGVIRLAKNNTLVQDLYSLEMLARVDVLCLDKTGTITDGRMKVNDCLMLSGNTKFTINEIIGSMLAALDDNNQTSIALYNHFGHNKVLSPVKILPFSSKRKLSAVTFEGEGTYVLGAPEFVMGELPVKVERLITSYAASGLRVLMVAHGNSQINGDTPPSNVKPIGLITITDNIREDAIQTIRWFKENDVAVKVISGDNPITVAEVARRAGIPGADKYISLEGLNEKEVISVALKYSVFGRVTPEQKAILVKALKAAGKTVAMTGDGVNDILALKEADCSISVTSGSEAARNVSHLVLMDNNFAAMPKVVYEGRRVINNIQKSSSLYLMKTIFTTVFALISIISRSPYVFATGNLFMLETFIIGIPSFALSLQPNSNRVKGKFLAYVLAHAIPAAIVLVFNVWLFSNLNIFLPGVDTIAKETMATISLTFAGLVLLYRICQPFNVYRAFLISLMFAFCLGAVFYFGQSGKLALGALNLEYVLLIVCLVQFDFPLSKWLLTLFNKMRIAEKE